MPPDDITAWDDYTARQNAREANEDLSGSIKPLPSRRRRTIEAKESSLAELLMQAIHLAGTRRGRHSQAERIREQTLLEVLTGAMRKAR